MISVTSPLDYETRRAYTLTVSTDDGRGLVTSTPEAQTTVYINVLVSIVEPWQISGVHHGVNLIFVNRPMNIISGPGLHCPHTLMI